jgi:hypothetical protein
MPTTERVRHGRAALAAALLIGPMGLTPVAAFHSEEVCTPDESFQLSAIAPIRVEDAFWPPLPPNAVRPAKGEFAEDNAEPDTTGDAGTR